MSKAKWFAVIVIILLLCSPACNAFASVSESNDNWSMFHHDASQTGFANSSAPKSTPKIAWTTGYEPKADFIPSSPIIADDIVYAADYTLYALNASTGKHLWNQSDHGYSSPVIVNGVIYTYRGAYNASTGTEIWENKNNGLYFATVADGYYYTCIDESESDGFHSFMVALNASTGATLWKAPEYYTRYSPAVAGDIIYISSGDISALDAHTGSKLWSSKLSPNGVEISPAIADGYVYACTVDGDIYCLNALTGETVWNRTVGRSGSYCSPAVAYGNVYVGSENGSVYAFNAYSGEKTWSYITYNSSQGYGVESSPAIADGVVYVGADDGNLYALNASTGIKLWSYELGEPQNLRCSPAIANGRIYIGSKGTLVIALETSSIPISDSLNQNLWIILLIVGVIVASTVAFALKKRSEN